MRIFVKCGTNDPKSEIVRLLEKTSQFLIQRSNILFLFICFNRLSHKRLKTYTILIFRVGTKHSIQVITFALNINVFGKDVLSSSYF